MARVVCMFPGQGSQEVGMGRDLQGDPVFEHLISLGSELLRTDLKKILWNGPDTLLRKASILQTSMAAVSLAYFRKLQERSIHISYVIGHSLGEIISLGAAGVVSDEDALRIALRRGELMDRVADSIQGGMLAVLFVPLGAVRDLITELSLQENLTIANENGDEQTVLSGSGEALDMIVRVIAERKLGKTQRLPVAGPWHSHSMNEAQRTFEEWIAPFQLRSPSIPMVFNATAQVESDPVRIKSLITGQLTRPVYWRQCMGYIRTQQPDVLIEVGPGRILSGLARVNGLRGAVEVCAINSLSKVEEIAARLSGSGATS